MTIKDVMTHEVDTVAPDSPIQDAAAHMKQMDVGMIPVHDGSRLHGVVTDRDIVLRAVAMGLDPRTTPVREIMTKEARCCRPGDDVQVAAQLMEREQIRRLIVMDEGDRMVGVVSLGDLAISAVGDRALAGKVLERVSEPTHANR
jgi:CBS domain-containing protein